MTTTLLQANDYDLDTRERPLVRQVRSGGGPEAISTALSEGLYVAVARVEGASPGAAWAATRDEGWAMRDGSDLTLLGPRRLDATGGALGYRPTALGDLLVTDAVVHVVGEDGPRPSGIRIPPDTEIRVIGGGSNVEALHGGRR